MALGVTLQFECTLRQRDVIGEWIKDGSEQGRWQNGLTWSHIGADGILRKKTLKTGAPAEHRLSDHPDLAVELDRVPLDRRVGPLVVDEKLGVPYTAERYRKWFRQIARAAGIPDTVWSMDARAGAITEGWRAARSLCPSWRWPPTRSSRPPAATTGPTSSRSAGRPGCDYGGAKGKKMFDHRAPGLVWNDAVPPRTVVRIRRKQT